MACREFSETSCAFVVMKLLGEFLSCINGFQILLNEFILTALEHALERVLFLATIYGRFYSQCWNFLEADGSLI